MDPHYPEEFINLLKDFRRSLDRSFERLAGQALFGRSNCPTLTGIGFPTVNSQLRALPSSEGHAESSDDSEVILVGETSELAAPDLPPQCALYRPPLIVGEVYIVRMESDEDNWCMGKLISVIFNVQRGVSKNRCYVMYSDGQISQSILGTSDIAYLTECPTLIPIGTNVVSNCISENSSVYQAGIVIEIPCALNHFRYLIFFENGDIRYAKHTELRVVSTPYPVNYSSSLDRKFVKDCITKFPNQYRLRLRKNESVHVKRSGRWLEAVVKAIDCSIAQLEFEGGELKWYSRGSNKFWKISIRQSSCTPKAIAPGPTTPNDTSRGNVFQVLTRLGKYVPGGTPTGKYIRGKCFPTFVESPQNAAGPEVSRFSCRVAIPHQPSPLKIITPTLLSWKANLGMHTCNEGCVPNSTVINRISLKLGPLARPTCVGFKRFLKSGNIVYRAPCGKMLFDFARIGEFLTQTKIPFDFGNFDFSRGIEPHRVFEANPNNVLASKSDISNGLEVGGGIPCINEVDNALPEEITYMVGRKFSTSGQFTNFNTDFVSCCSCTDDCQDKSKCECIQLTLNSYKATPAEDHPLTLDEMTYHYKRLFKEVRTGIYECNANCKCRDSCRNRVVQFPLQTKLQLFQTGKKGWGVRTLFDIPKGSFICTYVGLILNEKEANEWGILHGDEYLTDLDFVERQESYKVDFEELAPDVTDDDSGGESSFSGSFQANVAGPSSQADAPKRRRSSRSQSQSSTQKKKARRRPKSKKTGEGVPKKSLRNFYPVDHTEFTIDAKNAGNVGRYFNHSCEPNMFVQNVFVDTHDLRLPWVAFFAQHDIIAGSELSWNYNYCVGQVEGKRLYCYCLSRFCKRRLY